MFFYLLAVGFLLLIGAVASDGLFSSSSSASQRRPVVARAADEVAGPAQVPASAPRYDDTDLAA